MRKSNISFQKSNLLRSMLRTAESFPNWKTLAVQKNPTWFWPWSKPGFVRRTIKKSNIKSIHEVFSGLYHQDINPPVYTWLFSWDLPSGFLSSNLYMKILLKFTIKISDINSMYEKRKFHQNLKNEGSPEPTLSVLESLIIRLSYSP